MRAILDSGPLIALWNAEPDHLPWVEEVFKRFAGPFYITEPVLTEVAHLTGRDRLIVEALRSGKFLVPEGLIQRGSNRALAALRPLCPLVAIPNPFISVNQRLSAFPLPHSRRRNCALMASTEVS